MLISEAVTTAPVNAQEIEITSAVRVGDIYEHYSGKRYKVIGYGRSSEDLQLYVIYKGLYPCPKFGDNPVWIRPLAMFLETVTIEGNEVSRFKLIEAERAN